MSFGSQWSTSDGVATDDGEMGEKYKYNNVFLILSMAIVINAPPWPAFGSSYSQCIIIKRT